MATTVNSGTAGLVDEIRATRERWHTKNHPFFGAFAEASTRCAMGVYMALHYQFVQRARAAL